jgi:peptide/nickel transport system ATP-binding protein
MEELIRVENLTKEFPVQKSVIDKVLAGKERSVVHAVDDISFTIGKGEVLGLAGESGSGKSTTGRLLLRLIEPTAGIIRYKGTDMTEFSGREMETMREKLQIVFQDPNSSLSPRMSVGEAIEHPLKIHNLGNAGERKRRVLDLMERVGLTPAKFLYRKYPHQISGGQSQRVVLARALVTNPDFIVADEPIAMADVSVRALILELMKDLKKDFNLTYLFITHDLATAKYLCDRIAIMYLGRIVEIGSKDMLFGAPHHPYSRALLEAVPVPDPDLRRTEEVVRGEIPSAIYRPPGCHFHPRCPYAMEVCKQQRPPLKEIAPGHFSACVLEKGYS